MSSSSSPSSFSKTGTPRRNTLSYVHFKKELEDTLRSGEYTSEDAHLYREISSYLQQQQQQQQQEQAKSGDKKFSTTEDLANFYYYNTSNMPNSNNIHPTPNATSGMVIHPHSSSPTSSSSGIQIGTPNKTSPSKAVTMPPLKLHSAVSPSTASPRKLGPSMVRTLQQMNSPTITSFQNVICLEVVLRTVWVAQRTPSHSCVIKICDWKDAALLDEVALPLLPRDESITYMLYVPPSKLNSLPGSPSRNANSAAGLFGSVWIGTSYGKIYVLCAATKSLMKLLNFHTASINHLSEFAGTIFSCASDCTIIQWNSSTYKNEKIFYGHEKRVLKAVSGFGLFSGLLFSISEDNSLIVWAKESNLQMKKIIVNHSEDLKLTEMLVLDKVIWIGDSSGTLYVYDLSNMEKKDEITDKHSSAITCLLSTPSTVISVSKDSICIFDIDNRALIKSTPAEGQEGATTLKKISKANLFRMWSYNDKTLSMWNMHDFFAIEKNVQTSVESSVDWLELYKEKQNNKMLERRIYELEEVLKSSIDSSIKDEEIDRLKDLSEKLMNQLVLERQERDKQNSTIGKQQEFIEEIQQTHQEKLKEIERALSSAMELIEVQNETKKQFEEAFNENDKSLKEAKDKIFELEKEKYRLESEIEDMRANMEQYNAINNAELNKAQDTNNTLSSQLNDYQKTVAEIADFVYSKMLSSPLASKFKSATEVEDYKRKNLLNVISSKFTFYQDEQSRLLGKIIDGEKVIDDLKQQLELMTQRKTEKKELASRLRDALEKQKSKYHSLCVALQLKITELNNPSWQQYINSQMREVITNSFDVVDEEDLSKTEDSSLAFDLLSVLSNLSRTVIEEMEKELGLKEEIVDSLTNRVETLQSTVSVLDRKDEKNKNDLTVQERELIQYREELKNLEHLIRSIVLESVTAVDVKKHYNNNSITKFLRAVLKDIQAVIRENEDKIDKLTKESNQSQSEFRHHLQVCQVILQKYSPPTIESPSKKQLKSPTRENVLHQIDKLLATKDSKIAILEKDGYQMNLVMEECCNLLKQFIGDFKPDSSFNETLFTDEEVQEVLSIVKQFEESRDALLEDQKRLIMDDSSDKVEENKILKQKLVFKTLKLRCAESSLYLCMYKKIEEILNQRAYTAEKNLIDFKQIQMENEILDRAQTSNDIIIQRALILLTDLDSSLSSAVAAAKADYLKDKPDDQGESLSTLTKLAQSTSLQDTDNHPLLYFANMVRDKLTELETTLNTRINNLESAKNSLSEKVRALELSCSSDALYHIHNLEKLADDKKNELRSIRKVRVNLEVRIREANEKIRLLLASESSKFNESNESINLQQKFTELKTQNEGLVLQINEYEAALVELKELGSTKKVELARSATKQIFEAYRDIEILQKSLEKNTTKDELKAQTAKVVQDLRAFLSRLVE